MKLSFSFKRVYDDSDDEENTDTDRNLNTMRSSNNISFLSTECSSLADLKRSLHFKRPYKIWYSLRINSIPTEPVKHLEVKSFVSSSTSLELLLKNPQKENLNLDVIIDGFHLYGEASVTVKPYLSTVYQLQFSPVVTGKSKAWFVCLYFVYFFGCLLRITSSLSVQTCTKNRSRVVIFPAISNWYSRIFLEIPSWLLIQRAEPYNNKLISRHWIFVSK